MKNKIIEWQLKTAKIIKSKKFTPIVDKDLQVLYDYFSKQRAYLWDEMVHRDPKDCFKDIEKLSPYFEAIEKLNKKLLLA